MDAPTSACGSSSRIHVVAQEGRLAEFAGVKLLLASLQRQCPYVDVSLYISSELLNSEADRLHSIHPDVNLVEFDTDAGWACKPAVLLHALAQERDDSRLVLWLDTDIIILRDFSELADTAPEAVLSAEESNPNPNLKIEARQRILDLPTGPARQTTLSSAVIGVRKRHESLVKAWASGVETPAFKHQQQLPWIERLLPGDQEVWEATLCSALFAYIPVRVLRNFNEMLQGTYTSYVKRGETKRTMPAYFIHATGNLKPWRKNRMRLAQEMFPYFDHAQGYMDILNASEQQAFQKRSAIASTIKSVAGFGTYTAVRRAPHRLKERLHSAYHALLASQTTHNADTHVAEHPPS